MFGCDWWIFNCIAICYSFHYGVENGYDWVDLCRPWNESQWPVLSRCFTLSADAASDKACCKQYVCLSTRQRCISSCKDTIKQLQQEMPDFIGADLWPPNSPDLNQMDYNVWVLCSRECMNVMNSVYELKLRLIDVWNSLQQNVIDAAINDWRKQLRACMRADGQHFGHLLRARVTNKSYGQIKHNSKRCSFTAELVIFGVLKFPKVRYVQ